jgi:hypothetical protein
MNSVAVSCLRVRAWEKKSYLLSALGESLIMGNYTRQRYGWLGNKALGNTGSHLQIVMI